MHTQQKLSLLALSALFASVAAQEEGKSESLVGRNFLAHLRFLYPTLVPLFIPQTYVDAGALSLSIEGGAAALGGAETTVRPKHSQAEIYVLTNRTDHWSLCGPSCPR